MESTTIASLYAAEHNRMKQMLVRRDMSAQSAADAVQDAFIKLLRSPTTDIRDLRSYLRRTTETVIVDHYRREQRAARVVDPVVPVDENIADPLPLPDAAIISAEEIAVLAAAMLELPNNG